MCGPRRRPSGGDRRAGPMSSRSCGPGRTRDAPGVVAGREVCFGPSAKGRPGRDVAVGGTAIERPGEAAAGKQQCWRPGREPSVAQAPAVSRGTAAREVDLPVAEGRVATCAHGFGSHDDRLVPEGIVSLQTDLNRRGPAGTDVMGTRSWRWSEPGSSLRHCCVNWTSRWIAGVLGRRRNRSTEITGGFSTGRHTNPSGIGSCWWSKAIEKARAASTERRAAGSCRNDPRVRRLISVMPPRKPLARKDARRWLPPSGPARPGTW
jgi:hypothetical protein